MLKYFNALSKSALNFFIAERLVLNRKHSENVRVACKIKRGPKDGRHFVDWREFRNLVRIGYFQATRPFTQSFGRKMRLKKLFMSLAYGVCTQTIRLDVLARSTVCWLLLCAYPLLLALPIHFFFFSSSLFFACFSNSTDCTSILLTIPFRGFCCCAYFRFLLCFSFAMLVFNGYFAALFVCRLYSRHNFVSL